MLILIVAMVVLKVDADRVFVFAGGYAAAAVVLAVVQVLAERDGPFFANGYRGVVIDLLAVGLILTVGSAVMISQIDSFRSLPTTVSDQVSALAAQAKPFMTTGNGSIDTFAQTAVTFVSNWFGSLICCKIVAALVMFVAGDALRGLIEHASSGVAPLFGQVTTSGSRHRPTFAVTIDSIEAVTPDVERVLREHEAPATVFVTLAEARAEPARVAEIAAAGHEIGLLVPTSSECEGASSDAAVPGGLTQHLTEATEALSAASKGGPVVWARPAGGRWDAAFVRAANAAGLSVALWTAAPWEQAGFAEDFAPRVDEQATGYGRTTYGMILRIGAGSRTATAVNEVLNHGRCVSGLKPATLSDVAPRGGRALEA